MPFLTEVVVEPYPDDEGSWRLVWPLRYRGRDDSFVVPSGFVTDFASVPRLLWPIWSPYGTHTAAAIVHDWIYRTRPLLPARGSVSRSREITRREADGLFRRMMKELGTPAWRRWTMWLAVRAFGWISWHRDA